MSWYTIFYLGIQDNDGKITPLGPFDYKLDFKHVLCTSRSFTTDLKDSFYPITKEMLTDKLRREFPNEVEDEENIYQYFEYLPLKELPQGDWIKSGYYLLEDIRAYQEYKIGKIDHFEGFYNELSPIEYAMKLENEIKFGKPDPKYDIEGEELPNYTCADYAFYTYPDYMCKEYEVYLLRTVANILMEDYEIPEGSRIVVVKTEG